MSYTKFVYLLEGVGLMPLCLFERPMSLMTEKLWSQAGMPS